MQLDIAKREAEREQGVLLDKFKREKEAETEKLKTEFAGNAFRLTLPDPLAMLFQYRLIYLVHWFIISLS